MTDIVESLSDISRIRQGVSAIAAQLGNTSRIMWMLGPFMFSRDTAAPSGLKRSSDFGWAAQERFAKGPALQFTGPGADVIELDGTIYPYHAGGLGQVAAMRELAGLGRPQLLVDGRGMFYGKWAILRVDETGTHLAPNGTARKIEFRLSLQRYIDDADKRAGGRSLGIWTY
jgi:phage protein U